LPLFISYFSGMTAWDFWSVVSVAGIFQAALLLVFIALDKKARTAPNLLIGALLLWIIWLQLEFLVLRRSFLISNSFFFGSRHGTWLLLGPLIYHYLMVRFGRARLFEVGAWVHYLPFVLFTLMIPLFTSSTIPERVIAYGMLSVVKFPMLASTWLNAAYGYVFILQFIHAAIYLLISVRLVVSFQKDLTLLTSDNRQATLDRLKWSIGAITFFTITSIVFILILLKSQWYVREMDYLYILPLTFCIYLLSYFALREPGWFERRIESAPRYQQSKLEKVASRAYFERVNQVILTKKLYLNPELRLSDLAQESGITYHQLSEVINREAGTSFFEFINDFRINHVVATMDVLRRENKKINILEVAFAAGFNNKVSFNRHFKKLKGRTPTGYIKEIPKKA
jgi:AraC-like DNA-binding protein